MGWKHFFPPLRNITHYTVKGLSHLKENNVAAYLDLTLHGVRICSPVPGGGRRPLRLPREPDRISHRRRCLISRLCAWRPAQHLTFVKARQAAHAEQTRGNKVWRGKVLVLASAHTQKVSTFPAFVCQCVSGNPCVGDMSALARCIRSVHFWFCFFFHVQRSSLLIWDGIYFTFQTERRWGSEVSAHAVFFCFFF